MSKFRVPPCPSSSLHVPKGPHSGARCRSGAGALQPPPTLHSEQCRHGSGSGAPGGPYAYTRSWGSWRIHPTVGIETSPVGASRAIRARVIAEAVLRRTRLRARLRSFLSGSSSRGPRHSAPNEKWILVLASRLAPPQACSVKLESRPSPKRPIAVWLKSALAR